MDGRPTRRMKAGAILLSLWSGANFFLAAGILVAVTVLGRPPPSLPMALDPAQIAALAPQALALVFALAVFANACAAALCLLVLIVTWTALVAGQRWAFWALVAALLPLQAFGFVSDVYLGGHNLAANLASTALLVAGLALAAEAARPRR